MRNFLIFLVVLGAIAAIIVAPWINNVPKLDESVNAATATLNNQYKRRADLIPNLVAVVQGYASHEKDVFLQVTEARAKEGQITLTTEVITKPAAFKAFQEAQSGLSSALSKLLAVSERYPDLKANQNFLNLQAQLEGTENRIAVARADYIQAIKNYNLELRTIPGKWIAALLYPDAQVKQNFTATPSETAVPQVSFSK